MIIRIQPNIIEPTVVTSPLTILKFSDLTPGTLGLAISVSLPLSMYAPELTQPVLATP